MVFLNSSNKKKALVIGINYRGQRGELNGCINDTEKIKMFLKTNCCFKDTDINIITDDTSIKPNKQAILNSIISLVQDVKDNNIKEVWFSYSGHGYYMSNNNENDKKDEVLVPLDHERNGFIRDDTLYTLLVKELPKDCKLFSIIDACHSGTSLDLPYLYRTDEGIKEQRPQEDICKVLKISGCRDEQTSADAYINGRYQGALTFSFIRTMNDLDYNFTAKQLIEKIKTYINSNGYSQIPTLTFSDLNLLDEVVMGEDNPLFKNPNIKIFMEGDNWCNQETSWNILNINKNKLLFEKNRKFYQKNEKINYRLNLDEGRYILYLNDSYGDGGVVGNIRHLKNNNIVKEFNFNNGKNCSIDFTISNEIEELPQNILTNINVKIIGDYWCKYESRWNIINSLGNNIFPNDKVFNTKNEIQQELLSLEKGEYKLKCVDSYGDGGLSGLIINNDTKEKIIDFNFKSGNLKYYNFNI